MCQRIKSLHLLGRREEGGSGSGEPRGKVGKSGKKGMLEERGERKTKEMKEWDLERN